MDEVRRRTKDRFARHIALKAKNRKRSRPYVALPLGKAVTEELFLKPLADFLAGELNVQPPAPPGDLGPALSQLGCETVALAILAPLLNAIERNWRNKGSASAQMKFAESLGRGLSDRIALLKLQKSKDKAERKLFRQIRKGKKPAWKFVKSEWAPRECVAAGMWMMETAAAMPYFCIDDDGLLAIDPGWQERVNKIRERLLSRDPYLLPHLCPPPDWTQWCTQYDDRIRQTFVRDWRRQTRWAHEEKFKSYYEHADGVNALQRVPKRINQRILPLIERFAAELMNHSGERRQFDEEVVRNDVAIAKWIGDRSFYEGMHCDKRGRIYGNSHFNYGREDHVRALFLFASGMPVAPGWGVQWLEAHAATCHGDTAKRPWYERWNWSEQHRSEIEEIARDPAGAFELWRGADKPFSYAAACIELAGAWEAPQDFITHLPIAFDASCSGIQHLALLCRDKEAARLVNLTNETGEPQDIYGDVATRVMANLGTVDDEWAKWWRWRLRSLNQKQLRKLFKSPVMTFAYSVTDEGMAAKIVEVYRDLYSLNEPTNAAARYLATKVREACCELLSGPAKVMDFIRGLTESRRKRGLFLEWDTPTDFPVSNRYQHAREKRVYLTHGNINVALTVADGVLPKINKTKALDAASPNFVHSLDAAHLIKTTLAAVRKGINDLVWVHDSASVLAPQAYGFRETLLIELAGMYHDHDLLLELYERNARAGDPLPPQYGDLKPKQYLPGAEHAFL